MGSIKHATLTSELETGDKIGSTEWDAGHDFTLTPADLTGLGTGVATALGVNVGSAGAFVVLNGALGTPSSGTLTNCTFPTLNQNTTGSAATLTTARAIYGNNFNGSAALTQVIASTYGGTGNGFTKFSGPATSEKTFTLPNANDTVVCYGTAGSFTAAQTFLNLSGIKILDTDASHTLGVIGGSNLTGNRTLTLTTGDADRTLDISAGSVTISAAGAALIDDADATAQRTTLGLGTAAVKNTGTSGNTIPLLDSAACTWTNGAVFGGGVTLTSGNITAQGGHIRVSSAVSGIGYSTGAGSTVTQSTSKATGVAINRPTGEITLNNAALAAAAVVTFTMTNSALAAGDQLVATHHSAGTFGAYLITARVTGAGTADISVTNVSAGSLGEAIVIKFSLIKAVTS